MGFETLIPQLAPEAPIPALQQGRAVQRTQKRAMETKMKSYILSIFALILTGALVLSISGCQTIDGVGKDMSDAGDEISEEAQEHDDD